MKRRSFLGGLFGGILGSPVIIGAAEDFEKKPEKPKVDLYPSLDHPDIGNVVCSGVYIPPSFSYMGKPLIGPTRGEL
jgi:hypothetical protein